MLCDLIWATFFIYWFTEQVLCSSKQNKQLAACEEIFAAFDKKYIELELTYALLVSWV